MNIYLNDLDLAVLDKIGADYSYNPRTEKLTLSDDMKNQLMNCYNYGADCGINSFIYYADTVAFFNDNKKEIIALAKELADELGETGFLKLATGFKCFKGMTEDEIASGIYEPESENETTVKNGFAWLALEETARKIAVEIED